ncbi:methyl-accepting chemotaxis protein [Desulfuromonas sp. AOP6]|uniref:methyl-accepting chemotaxis protein n=1 Tax=Desulfuromonas sp. AOP6 TaxID=1566351 RepID=UPI00126D0502|nr:methyl-accepting chemotaxis protein [Desulfuromonas sp. AOP6]BCA78676.1 hypothetical protein AOP6_0463 [Desulfuromonas sp. AOP6]
MAQPAKNVRTIRRKLVRVALFFTVVSLVTIATSYYFFYRSHTALLSVANEQVEKLGIVDQMSQELALMRGSEKDFLLAASRGDENAMEQYSDALYSRVQGVPSLLGQLKALSVGNIEITRSISQMEAIQADLLSNLDILADTLFEGATLAQADPAIKAFSMNLREFSNILPVVKRAVLKDVARGKTSGAWSFSMWAIPVVALVLVLIGLFSASVVGKRITASFEKFKAGVANLSEGNFDEIHVDTHDELAEVASLFNESLHKLQDSIITESEREETQNNLIGFLEVVSEAADGDLTVKAPVTADAFGSIADAYNLMVDSLAEQMADTRRKAEEVGRESQHLLEIFKTMEAGAEKQAAQVREATEFVNETSSTTLEISEKATLAQETSALVDQVTGQGNNLVMQNIEGMQLIRVTVQVINKKMKSLSERLLEIGTISQLISEVATRTTILAMNASIEAARAGEQGRGFLVISDEIKRLADKSAEATKQITGIIKAIQTEAGEVTASLEEETRTVEGQTKLAQDTGDAFSEIQKAIGDSKQVVTEIFDLSQKQQHLTNEAVLSMKEVSVISKQASSMVKDSARISDGLHDMSETLLNSLSQFILPGEEDDLLQQGVSFDLSGEKGEMMPAEEIEDDLVALEDEIFDTDLDIKTA